MSGTAVTNYCSLCMTPATDDDFCHGCEEYVCEKCCVGDSVADHTMGKHSHNVGDHAEEFQEVEP